MISINDISEQAKKQIDLSDISLTNSVFDNLPDILLFLVLKFNFDDVWKKYVELYPCENKRKEFFLQMFEELLGIANNILKNPTQHNISNTSINIKMLDKPPYQNQEEKEKGIFPEPYFEVYGSNENSDFKETQIDLEFFTRTEWLLLKISRKNCVEKYICYNDVESKVIVHMSDLDILCHCLMEMTFMGYSDAEVKEQKEFCEQQNMDSKFDELKKVFKDGDWVFGIGEHKGCSIVFTHDGRIQPFDYLNDYNPADFRIATAEEIESAKCK